MKRIYLIILLFFCFNVSYVLADELSACWIVSNAGISSANGIYATGSQAYGYDAYYNINGLTALYKNQFGNGYSTLSNVSGTENYYYASPSNLGWDNLNTLGGDGDTPYPDSYYTTDYNLCNPVAEPFIPVIDPLTPNDFTVVYMILPLIASAFMILIKLFSHFIKL